MDQDILLELANKLGVPQSTIRPSSNFHQLGGNSITALAVSSACKSRGICIDIASILMSESIADIIRDAKHLPTRNGTENDNSRLETSQYAVVPSSNQDTRLCRLSSDTPDARRASNRVLKEDPMAHCPLLSKSSSRIDGERYQQTNLQSILVMETRERPGNNVISYFQEYSVRQVPVLKLAWQKVLQSEPIFRAVFEDNQVIENGTLVFSWSETILHDHKSFQDQLAKVETPKMIRPATEFQVITLLNCAQMDEKSVLVWHVHHALVDGYSAGIILEKVRMAMEYGSVHMGLSFKGLVYGLQEYQAKYAQQAEKFWRQYLGSHKVNQNELLLPPRENVVSEAPYATDHITFNTPLQQILAHSREDGVPAASLYYAAWALVLSQYTGSDTVSMGIVFSNRSLPIAGILETVGPTMNTLPLLLSVDRAFTIDNFVRYVTDRVASLSEYQWSKPEPGTKYASVLAMQYDYEIDPKLSSSAGKSYTRLQTSIPIHIFLGPGAKIQINYLKNSFGRKDMENLGSTYLRAIEMLTRCHNTTIGWYFSHSLSAEIVQTLLSNGNCFSSTSRETENDTLMSLFENCCLRKPDSIAVAKGDCILSYSELDEAATRVSLTLQPWVKPGEVICVYADRSINWIIAVYAVLKVGAVYCPFDPTSPSDLRNSYFQTSGSRIFIAPDDYGKAQKPSQCSICFSVAGLLSEERNASKIIKPTTITIPHFTSDEDAAYLCFTSGSTGMPKGVICTHKGIIAFQKDYHARLHSRWGLRIAQVLSPAFDGSIHEIFSSLSYGATLILNDSKDPFHNIKHAQVAMVTPSIARMLSPSDYTHLEAIYFVGEPLPQDISDCWSGIIPSYNMYGPTESSCGSTYQHLAPGHKVTIGRPVNSTRIYILDNRGNLAPPGVIGEVYTAGLQVSPGYIGRPEETARSFLRDTICPGPGQMMYRTGDHGYWTSSGEIALLGRADRQIKLRGFRMDLNDLEIRMLRAHSDATAVAVARKDDMLVAMVQPATVNTDAFRASVSKALPPQSVPRLVKVSDEFPLVSAGKIDYKAIIAFFDVSDSGLQQTFSSPNSSVSDLQRNTNHTPSSEAEGSLGLDIRGEIISTWRAVLNLDSGHHLDDDSNFTDLGGQSISQLALANRLSSVLAQKVPLLEVVRCPRLGDQVVLFQSTELESSPPEIEPEDHRELGNVFPSPIERDWWEKYTICKGSSSFNVNLVCSMDSKVDLKRLIKAWNESLKQHKILRSLFRGGAILTRSYAESSPQVICVDNINLRKEINRPFKLAEELPLRLFATPNLLILVASHIVMDLTSLKVILREVEASYRGDTLPAIVRHYEQTRRWSRAITQNDLDFWNERLSNLPSRPVAKRNSYAGKSRVCKVPLTVFNSMTRFTLGCGMTFHQFALAAVALALRFTNPSTRDVVLGAPFLNRDIEDFETVGLFLEPLPIRIEFPPSHINEVDSQGHAEKPSMSSHYIKGVRQTSQASLSHAIPWNRLLSHLGIEAEHPNVPFLEAMVTFHDNRGQTLLDIPGLKPLYTWCEGSKFNLMVEFSAISDEALILRLEYDDALYDSLSIQNMERYIVIAVHGLSQEQSPEQIWNLMSRDVDERHYEFDDDGERYFGVSLDAV